MVLCQAWYRRCIPLSLLLCYNPGCSVLWSQEIKEGFMQTMDHSGEGRSDWKWESGHKPLQLYNQKHIRDSVFERGFPSREYIIVYTSYTTNLLFSMGKHVFLGTGSFWMPPETRLIVSPCLGRSLWHGGWNLTNAQKPLGDRHFHEGHDDT